MTGVPPLLKASWRLQSSSFILLFGFSYDLFRLLRATDTNKSEEFSPETRKRYIILHVFEIINFSFNNKNKCFH